MNYLFPKGFRTWSCSHHKLILELSRAKTYLFACIRETRTARGRNFNIRDSETTSDIGKCIAQKLGILENNIVNKAKLTVLINAARENGKLNQAQYQKYSTLVRDCNDWEGCLKRHCHL